MLKNKKVKITNPEESVVIQKKAFELGWTWRDADLDGETIKSIVYTTMYFTEDKAIDYAFVGCDIEDESFEEVTPEWILRLEKTDVDFKDNVTKPSHYNRGNIEVIDFIQDQQLNFNLGNVIKYVTRAGFKEPDKKVEDLKKAKYYLEYELKQLENEKQ